MSYDLLDCLFPLVTSICPPNKGRKYLRVLYHLRGFEQRGPQEIVN